MKTSSEIMFQSSSSAASPSPSPTIQRTDRTKEKVSDTLCWDPKGVIRCTSREIMAIKRILESRGTNEKDILMQLGHYFEQVFRNSPKSTKEKFRELKSLAGKTKSISLKSISPRISDFNLVKLITIYDGMQKLKRKSHEISLFKAFPGIIKATDIDGFYLSKITGSIHSDTFLRLFGSEREYLQILSSFRNGERLSEEESRILLHRRIQDITSNHQILKGSFENFSLNLIFNGDDFDEIAGAEAGGMNHDISVINFIRNRDNPQEVTDAILHESTHTIYEAFFADQQIEDTRYLNIKLLQIIRNRAGGGAAIDITRFLDEMRKWISGFLRSATPEIIADFEKMKKGSISTAFGNYHMLIEQLTAIYYAIDSDTRITKSKRDELKMLIRGLISHAIKEYRIIYSHLADYVYICEKEDKSNVLFSLLIIYGIGKHQKIENHLKDVIGKERYEYHKIMRAIIKPQYFRLPKQDVGNKENELECAIFNIKRTKKEHEIGVMENPLSFRNLEFLLQNEAPPCLLDKKNRNLIINSFSREDFDEVFIMNQIDTDESLGRYLRLFDSVLKKLNIDSPGRDHVLEKILADYENMHLS